MPAVFLSLLPVLLGGVLSLAGSWGAVWWTKKRDESREAKQLARAFKGEISAIIHIAKVRKYSELFRQASQSCLDQDEILIYSVQAREEYRAVYKANVGKLGSLDGLLPTKVAILYTQMASLLEDFKCLDEARSDPHKRLLLGDTAAKAAQTYLQLAELIEDTIAKGDEAVADIDRRYSEN